MLIKAEAIGVNFIDTYFRAGLYQQPLPFVVDSEVCGTVAGIGGRTDRVRVGDRVATSDAVGPVPPVDPQRLNAAVSVYLTRRMRTHFNRTYDEFAWRSSELFDAILSGDVSVTTGTKYSLSDAADAHRDLEARKTHGSTVLIP